MKSAKRVVALVLAVMFTVAFAVPAFAYDAKWYESYSGKAFKCIHPKSKIQKVESLVAPKVEKNVETARVKIYYKGFIKKHSMTLDISTTKIGGKENVKVVILEDSSSIKNIKCNLVKGWQPL